MGKKILEAKLTVISKTHKKKLKEGTTEYHYGSVSLDNPLLYPYVGKTVKVKIEELVKKRKIR